jgi:hypothetical protein
MALKITMQTDNDAFAQDLFGEVSRALKIVAGKISSGQDAGSIWDSNGNRVGEFDLDVPEADEDEDEDEDQYAVA